MNRKSTAIISGMTMALCLMLTGNELRAQSDAANTEPLSLTVSLVGSSMVVLGEPILLKYVIKNNNDQPASVYTKDIKHNSLITEQFTEVGGKELVPAVSRIIPHKKTDEFRVWDGLGINGNAAVTWDDLANAGVTFPHPGSYILHVHAQNKYVVGDIDQGAHLVLNGDYTFPLKVVAAKPAYLHSTAERLRQSILRTTDVSERATLIKALFSMPEASAASSWQLLVEEPKLDGAELNEIGMALEGLRTIKAADILAEMIWNPVRSPDTLDGFSPSEHLYNIYDAGDPALRKHIEDLHKQHGASMSHFTLE